MQLSLFLSATDFVAAVKGNTSVVKVVSVSGGDGDSSAAFCGLANSFLKADVFAQAPDGTTEVPRGRYEVSLDEIETGASPHANGFSISSVWL